MQIQTTDSAIQLCTEQGDNPVQTGLLPQDVIDILEEIAGDWPINLAVQTFKAVLKLHQQSPGQAGFTALEIGEILRDSTDRKWHQDLSNTDDVAKKIRQYWSKLNELWAVKSEGVQQQLLSAGYIGCISPYKFESVGGAGNPSRYAIQYFSQPKIGTDQDSVQVVKLAAGEVEYFTDDLLQEGWLLRIFSAGLQLSGWRRLLFILPVVAYMLIFLILTLLFIILLFWPGVDSDLRSIVALFALLGMVGISVMPSFNLVELRIIKSPQWLQTLENDVVLEWRCPPRYAAKHIQAVRYKARCTICGGRVRIRHGGLRFWGRLVGICEESPREHIFSFDHVMRRGTRL